jgi:hypothetical protein
LPYPADVICLQEWSEEKYVKTETGIYNFMWLVGSKIKESTPNEYRSNGATLSRHNSYVPGSSQSLDSQLLLIYYT